MAEFQTIIPIYLEIHVFFVYIEVEAGKKKMDLEGKSWNLYT